MIPIYKSWAPYYYYCYYVLSVWWHFQAGNKIEGLLPLFWGPALHIPFKKEGVIFYEPFKMNGKKKVNGP